MRHHKICKILSIFFTAIIMFCALSENTFANKQVGKYTWLSVDAFHELIKKESNNENFVLVSIFASWCPPCRAEMPTLMDFYDKLPANFKLIGISADHELAALTAFDEEFKINFPIYLADVALFHAYEIEAIPLLIVFDKGGQAIHMIEGALSEAALKYLTKQLLEGKDE